MQRDSMTGVEVEINGTVGFDGYLDVAASVSLPAAPVPSSKADAKAEELSVSVSNIGVEIHLDAQHARGGLYLMGMGTTGQALGNSTATAARAAMLPFSFQELPTTRRRLLG